MEDIVKIYIILLLFLTTLLYGKSKTDSEQRKKEEHVEAINVIQKKIITNKNKVELFPAFALSVNSPFYYTYSFAGGLGYHFQETLYVELFGGISKINYKDSAKDLPREANVSPEIAIPKFFADLNLVWAPISGKFSFMNSTILYFEYYISGGMGYIKTNNVGTNSFNFGLGQKYYLSDWLAFRFEIKDHIYAENFDNILVPNKKAQTAKPISHFMNVYLGISLFF